MNLQSKYTPKTMDNLIMDEKILDQIIQWANSWLNHLVNTNKPGLLLVGFPGIGKTLTARCLANDCNWNLMEFNASDTRNKESLMHLNIPKEDIFGRQTCVLFDEVDSMDKGGEIILKRFIATGNRLIILTANDKNKISKEIKDQCEIVQLYRPSVNILKNQVLKIVRTENLKISPEIIQSAAETQDYRMAFNILESGVILQKKEKRLTIKENIKNLLSKEAPTDIEEIKSYLYYLDENSGCYNDYSKFLLFEAMNRVDQLQRRGQQKFAINKLKEIPQWDLELEEINSPVYFERERLTRKGKKKEEISSDPRREYES